MGPLQNYCLPLWPQTNLNNNNNKNKQKIRQLPATRSKLDV